MRDTITPTVLSASQKTNVISETAYAEVDCRLLPGSDPKTVMNDIKKVIADDTIKIDVILNFPPISSPSRSPLMTAIETLATDHDQATVVPSMIIGFTDSHYFRQKKIVSYGFIPIEVVPAEGKGVHGINERIGVKELADGIQRMVELLKIFGGRIAGDTMIRGRRRVLDRAQSAQRRRRGDRRRARAGGAEPRATARFVSRPQPMAPRIR